MLARLALPYARLELPGWGRVLRTAGVYDDARWQGAPVRTIRGKLHGYRMRLSLESWAERQTYFLGRYFELPTQRFLMACLRPGDTLIDVGGNIGMITLLGARLVGATGRVHTFEPNPQAAAAIREALDDNRIASVTLHYMGLSDAPAELTLSVVTEHLGMGTFASVAGSDAALVSARHTARVMRGDELLGDSLTGAVTIKIDVEGFECRALRGLEGTLRRYRPAVITEVMGQHLQRAGASVGELFELMRGLGYRAYDAGLKRRFGLQRLALRAMEGKPDEEMDSNVAWVMPETVQEARVRGFIVR
jgi:FkbM family methyltransferase